MSSSLVAPTRTEPYEAMVPASPTHPALIPAGPDDPRLLVILDAIMDGEIGFRDACVAQGFKPSLIRQWAVRDTPVGFRAAYQEARRVEMDAFAESIIATADGSHRGEEKDTPGPVYRDQLSVRTKQWLMQRRAAMDFGDRGPVDAEGRAIPKQVIIVGGQSIVF